MNKYFIQLFLKENTVILPGFGALTVPNGNLEEIMFVPYLTMDDGKLAAFIAETEGVDPQDAQNTIAKFIREMEAKISKGESFDIFQFGSFSKNDSGDIEFTSWLKNKPANEEEEAPASEDQASAQGAAKQTVIDEPSAQGAAKQSIIDKPSAQGAAKQPEIKKDSSPESVKPVKEDKEPVTKPSTKKKDGVSASETKPKTDKSTEVQSPEKEEFIVEPISFQTEAITESEGTKTPKVNAEDIRKEPIHFHAPEKDESEVIVTKTVAIEEKKKRRFGVGFWILNVLVLCLIAGSIYTYLNYDQLKTKFPFLAKNEKKSEAKEADPDQEKTVIADTVPEVKKEEKVEKAFPAATKKNPEPPKPIEKQTSTTVLSQDAKGYFLIGGAFGSESQAQKKVDQLKKEGIEAKILPQKKGSVYVSLGEFTDNSSANIKLKELRAKGLKVWVLKQ